jgi:hypothetical protein
MEAIEITEEKSSLANSLADDDLTKKAAGVI